MGRLKELSSKLRSKLAWLFGVSDLAAMLRDQHDDAMALQGRTLALQIASRAPLSNLRQCEFKVFSQFGEDGIIQYLIRETAIRPTEMSFIEFGVQDYCESNTRFLLMNDNWRGLIIDGSEEYMNRVRASKLYWRHELTALAAWIDRDNVNTLFSDSSFTGPLGILSVDIDGNDYWVWERISVVDPVIVVAEYNSVFGPVLPVSVPYHPTFQRTEAHSSNLYWGASLAALAYLASTKGYALVAANAAGNNAFFVKHERLGRLRPITLDDAYVDARFRESRASDGSLTYLSGPAKRDVIAHLPLVNVIDGQTSSFRELLAVS